MKTVSDKTGLVKKGLWLGALFLILYTLAIIFGENGLMTMRSMHQELNRIQQENARLEKENIALYRTIHRLKNDPAFIEQIARQELNMIRPGEIVFSFDNSQEKDN